MKPWLFPLILTFFFGFHFSALATPKLVVVLVIDQFRADNLTRFTSRFLPAKDRAGHLGGFSYLISNGAYFPFAQYDILQPMTGPGHATILSGSYPYLGGIPTNDWYSHENKSKVYCVEDPEFETLGDFKAKPHLGTSPRNFLGTTVGDELKNTGWPSKVVSVAIKDRAAILLGGQRADVALWMDAGTFRWVSSRFYFPAKKLPSWVQQLNERLAARAGQRFLWELPPQPETSLAIFNVQHEGDNVKSVGESFPHTITRSSLSEIASPAGLDLTVEAAEAAVEGTKLGTGRGPDLLAVSFSSHDYVGHAFGPDSRENEEMVAAEDRAISTFINFLGKKIPGGLKNVMFALTADHGVAPNAEWLVNHRINAGVIDPKELHQRLEKKLEEKFGSVEKLPWLSYSVDFSFWFNREAMKEKRIAVEPLAEEVKRLLLEEKGFAYAFTAADVAARRLPPGLHERRILKTFVPGRSGDVVGLVRPFYYVKEQTANHMADYTYDETVPLVLSGAGIKAGKYATKAEVVDLAPTLSFLLGSLAPSLSEGRVLSEALEFPQTKKH
ncbi:MAG: alkaline phosphatase family protein [Bdellovibrionota bacterium]